MTNQTPHDTDQACIAELQRIVSGTGSDDSFKDELAAYFAARQKASQPIDFETVINKVLDEREKASSHSKPI